MRAIWDDDDDFGYGFGPSGVSRIPRTVGSPMTENKVRKVSILKHNRLSEDDFGLLTKLEPDLILAMMRRRLSYTYFPSPIKFLSENCSGLFYIDESCQVIWFEKEEDMVLFMSAHQGKEV